MAWKAKALEICAYKTDVINEQISALYARRALLEVAMGHLEKMPSDVADALAEILSEVPQSKVNFSQVQMGPVQKERT